MPLSASGRAREVQTMERHGVPKGALQTSSRTSSQHQGPNGTSEFLCQGSQIGVGCSSVSLAGSQSEDFEKGSVGRWSCGRLQDCSSLRRSPRVHDRGKDASRQCDASLKAFSFVANDKMSQALWKAKQAVKGVLGTNCVSGAVRQRTYRELPLKLIISLVKQRIVRHLQRGGSSGFRRQDKA